MTKILISKPNLTLYSLYYAEACNEFMVPNSATKQHSYLRRCWSSGEPFETLCKMWPAWDSNSQSPEHEARVSTVRGG